MPLLFSLLFLSQVPDSVSILIRNGTVYDGSGGPARQIDAKVDRTSQGSGTFRFVAHWAATR